MGIKIIDEGDIHLTRAEMERLMPEYEASQQYTTRPCSFETWVRRRKASVPDLPQDFKDCFKVLVKQ